MSEAEEFEFRARAEREAAPKPAANDPLTAGPAGVASEMSESERRLAGVGHAMAKPFEAGSQLVQHFLGKGAEADAKAQENQRLMDTLHGASAKDSANRPDIVPPWLPKVAPLFGPASTLINAVNRMGSRGTETLTEAAGAGAIPAARIPGLTGALGRILSGGLTGSIFGASNPVTSGKDFTTEKMKQSGQGALWGAGSTAALEGLARTPGLLKNLATRFGFLSGPQAAAKPAGEAAQKVTGELQRQRNVLTGKEPPRQGPVPYPSAAEEHLLQMEQEATPMRDAAFKSGARVGADDTLARIEALKAKNPDKAVRRSLDEVADTIKNAVESSKSTAALPAAGARMTPAQLKAFQRGMGGMDVPMVDEVRQSINRMIDAKGEKALDKHTQALLKDVRDELVGRTPKEYQDYLKKYGEIADKLRPLKSESSVISRLSSAEKGAQPLSGADAQKALDSVLSGKTSSQDLKGLVDATKHSKGATTALKGSYADWLIQVDAVGEIETSKMLTRWRDSRDAVQSSGLFDKQHFDNLDGIMTKLQGAYKEGTAARLAGNMTGWFVGGGYRGAFLGRQIGGAMTKQLQRDLEQQVVRVATNSPEAASLFNKPQTPENVKKLGALLSKILPYEKTQQTPPQKAKAR